MRLCAAERKGEEEAKRPTAAARELVLEASLAGRYAELSHGDGDCFMETHHDGARMARKALQPGEIVDHYQVVRLLGRGGMGEVYLARDTKLGRKVALKVVRGDSWANENHRARFLVEARVTARFNHPHIVTVYGVGEIAGCAYVALEYLAGETLRQRLRGPALGVREALRFALAIAEALAEAHAHRILHWDLKPANVMLPRDGRLRVVDFGLARALTDFATTGGSSPEREDLVPPTEDELDSSKLQGTPKYMAPERWLGREAEEATDIWSYGLIVQELLGGGHPYAPLRLNQLFAELCSRRAVPLGDMPSEVPPELATLFRYCLDKTPANRPSASEIASAIERHLSGAQAPVSGDINPFRGLLPFTERHASLFFGRDAEVDAFLERMRTESVLPVVGPSGAGKSSFVQAGIVPRLRERGRWIVLQVRPGREPFAALSEAFESAEAQIPASIRPGLGTTQPLLDPRPVSEQVLDSPGRLAILLLQLAERSQCHVLLFVDQLEELYTLVDDAWVRRRYMQAVCAASDDPTGPVRVAFTLRDDFLGRVADTVEAQEALGHITVLRSPDTGALREILERPMRLVGYDYEDAALVDTMTEAVRGEHAGLPILQFACAQLWQRRDRSSKRLTRAAYEAMGGVEGALARHSDAILDALTPQQGHVARTVFLRLVTAEGTRRVVPRSELADGLGPEGERVIEILTNERVVGAHKGRMEGSDDAEIELVHESLLRNWERLARWIDESREELAFVADAAQAAELWDKRGRPNHEVWQGDALRDALRTASRAATIPARVRAFLEAGRAWEERRTRRKRVVLGFAFAALVMVVVLFAIKEREARREGRVAQEQRQQAELQRAQAQREGAEAALARGQFLEARAMLRGSLETRDSAAARALWWRLERAPMVWSHDTGSAVYEVVFDTDDASVLAVGMGKAIHVIDRTTSTTQLLRGGEPQNLSLAVSHDGKWFASGNWSGRVRIRSRKTDTSRVIDAHGAGVLTLRFAPDSSLLASGGLDNTVRLWDPASGQERRLLRGHTARVNAIAFAPDGRWLVTASSDNSLRRWDVATGKELAKLLGHESDVLDVAVSADGKRIVSAGGDATLRVWDAATGRATHVLRGHAGAIMAVDIAADSATAVTGSNDATIRLWDVAKGVAGPVVRGHEAGVDSVRFSADGQLLASGGKDGKVRLWRVAAASATPSERGHSDTVLDVTISPNGKTVASAGHDGTVRLWDAATGEEVAVLRGHDNAVRTVAYHPDGQSLASAGEDLGIRIWDAATGGQRKVLYGHESTIHRVRFHPSGGTLASASSDGTIRLWKPDTGSQILVLRGHARGVMDLAFSEDGKRLASASSDGTVRIWETETGKSISSFEAQVGQVWGVAWGPGDKRIAFGGLSGEAVMAGQRGEERRSIGKVEGRLYGLVFDRLGGRAGAPCSDGTARIWQLDPVHETVLRGHRAELDALAFSADGSLTVTAADDGTVRTWDTKTGRRRWFATVMAGDRPVLYSHRGWTALDGSKTPVSFAWQRSVDRTIASGSASADGQWLCTRGFDGSIALWDINADRSIARLPPKEGVDRVEAMREGCVFRVDGTARLLSRDGTNHELSPYVSAMSATERGVLIAARERVVEVDRGGRELSAVASDVGVSAVLAAGGRWIVGYDDGAIEVVNPEGGTRTEAMALLDVPSSAVARLLEGPMGTLVAGFDNGVVGVWDMHNGQRLLRMKLHGPITTLAMRGRRLVAVSELGQTLNEDFGVFHEDSCSVLRSIWEQVPVAWDNGRLKVSEPPEAHRCRSDR